MAKKATEPKQASMLLTPEDQDLIAKLRQKFGLDLTSVVRLAIRRVAEAEGLRQ